MDYLLRSMLFVPAYSEKFIEKAITCEADAIIFDLEDSVPQVKREEARKTLSLYLNKNVFEKKQVFLRVNELGTEDLLADLDIINSKQIHGIVVPKIRNASDVQRFEKYLEMCEVKSCIDKGYFKLLPLIETAEAVLNVQSITEGSKRIIALLFGGEDFLEDVDGRHDYPPKAFDVPRAIIAMAARMHEVLPIDTPYLDLKNEEGFLEEERVAKSMGYAGALLVTPGQVSWANKCFSPSEEEVEHAKRVMEAVDIAQHTGGNIATLNGKMIGPPMLKRAKKVLKLDGLIKEKR